MPCRTSSTDRLPPVTPSACSRSCRSADLDHGVHCLVLAAVEPRGRPGVDVGEPSGCGESAGEVVRHAAQYAGADPRVGPMNAELYAYPDSARPWIRTNFVATVDGSSQDSDGVSGSLGGDADQRAFTIMRSLADLVLVSAGTARAEGYGPVDPADLDPVLTGGVPPVLAVVSRSLDVPAALRVRGVVVITSRAADTRAVEGLRADGVEVLQHGDEDVAWTEVLEELASRGLTRLLCEGGPSLHSELLAADLVDEVCLTIAPVMASGQGQRIAHAEAPVDRAMTLGHAVAVDGVLLTRWVRERT